MNLIKPHLEHKSHIIWDWNGTLLNDVTACVGVISEILREHDLPEISEAQYRAQFRFPIAEYYKSLGFDFSKTSLAMLSDKFVTRYKPRAMACSLFDGARELLATLHGSGIPMSILSAANEAELKELTRHHQIDHYFGRLCGLSDFYAASKIERGRELIAELGIEVDEIILVGDTDHDLEVARALGVDALILADGHQSYERLQPLHSRVFACRY